MERIVRALAGSQTKTIEIPIPLPLYSGITDSIPIYPRGRFTDISSMQTHTPTIFPSWFLAYSVRKKESTNSPGNAGNTSQKEMVCE